MKKSILFTLTIGMIIVFSLLQSSQVIAQENLPPSDINGKIFFRDLEFSDSRLFGPYQSERVLFSFPAEYKLAPGGELVLNLETTVNGADKAFNKDDYWVGTLNVRMNNDLIFTIELDENSMQTVRIPIPEFALDSVREDGRHEITFDLLADISCYYEIITSLLIKDTSYLTLPYVESPPDLSLANLPAPFFILDGFVKSKVNIVVPDNPNEKELEAAMLAATAFGNLTRGEMELNLVTTSDIDNGNLAPENLILVGLSSSIAEFTSEIELPLPIDQNGSFTISNEDDGIIQLSRSPWNNAKTILLITGNTQTGIRKAAQALSSGSILITSRPDLVVISDVQTKIEKQLPISDLTFKDLGYQTENISNFGSTYIDILFDATVEQINSKDSYIELVINYPNTIDNENSVIDLSLNDEPIGVVVFDQEEGENLSTHRINIPPGTLIPGRNNLQILVLLSPLNPCIFDFAWVTISETSHIHLATTNLVKSQYFPGYGLNLNAYPDFLIYGDTNLDEFALVVAKSNTASWNTAAKLLYQVGNLSLLEIPNFTAWYADNVPENVKTDKTMMVVGQATILPFISEINENLPAPFENGSDVPQEPGMRISYRIPPEIDLGYLELLPSPWNPDNSILAVLGNSEAGIEIAGNMILNPIFANRLAGDFAYSNGVQIISANSKVLTGEERPLTEIVPEATAVIVEPDAGLTQSVEVISRQPWLFPALISTSLLIVVVLGFVVIRALLNRSKSIED